MLSLFELDAQKKNVSGLKKHLARLARGVTSILILGIFCWAVINLPGFSNKAKTLKKTDCMILDTVVKYYDCNNGYCRTLRYFEVELVLNNNSYKHWIPASYGLPEDPQKLLNEFPLNKTHACWYNPEDPEQIQLNEP